MTGSKGAKRSNNRAWLLLDEAQESYWDDSPWLSFFRQSDKICLELRQFLVVLFIAYGSTGQGIKKPFKLNALLNAHTFRNKSF